MRTGADSDLSAPTATPPNSWEGTNWAKTGDLITKYTHLAVYGIAAITQILAGLGIAP